MSATRKRWGKVWNFERFAEAVTTAHSFREVCRIVGVKPGGYSYESVCKRIAQEGLVTDHFESPLAKPLSEVMVKNSSYDRGNLKKQIIRKKILPYICAVCGQLPFWNGKPLVLRLDHINGVNNDHRLKNLRFVCPNCDSQLPTFTGRNTRKCRVA